MLKDLPTNTRISLYTGEKAHLSLREGFMRKRHNQQAIVETTKSLLHIHFHGFGAAVHCGSVISEYQLNESSFAALCDHFDLSQHDLKETVLWLVPSKDLT